MNWAIITYLKIIDEYFNYLNSANNDNYETVVKKMRAFRQKINTQYLNLTGKTGADLNFLSDDFINANIYDKKIIADYQKKRDFIKKYDNAVNFENDVKMSDDYFAKKAKDGKYLLIFSKVNNVLVYYLNTDEKYDKSKCRFEIAQVVSNNNVDFNYLKYTEITFGDEFTIPLCLFTTKAQNLFNGTFQQWDLYDDKDNEIYVNEDGNDFFNLKAKKDRKLTTTPFLAIALVPFVMAIIYYFWPENDIVLTAQATFLTLDILALMVWLWCWDYYDADIMDGWFVDNFTLNNGKKQYTLKIKWQTTRLIVKTHRRFMFVLLALLLLFALSNTFYIVDNIYNFSWIVNLSVLIISLVAIFISLAVAVYIYVWTRKTKVTDNVAAELVKEIIKNEPLLDNNFKIINAYNFIS